MAFNCRIFGHTGLSQIIVPKPLQYSADSVYVLMQPYVFSQVLSVSAVAVESAAVDDSTVTILRIEVPDGETIRYEINLPGQTPREAGNDSPSLSGKDQFYFRTGWTISMVDAADFP